VIRELERMASDEQDVLVVGGGIQGVSIARALAERGCAVALVEKDDFGAATSSNSQRVIHGGVRYLQTFDFARMRRSVLERRTWMLEFPDLVRPRPIVMPTFASRGKPRAVIRAGMTLYEWLNPDRSSGLSPAHRTPGHESLSRDRAIERAPILASLPIDGAIVFHDAMIEDSERLTIGVARAAWRAGAELANHAWAKAWIEHGGRVRGAHVRDALNGREHEVRARLVIHAGGPWAASSCRPPVPLVRAMALVTRSIDDHVAIAVPSSRAGRLLFFTPWRGFTIAGVHEAPFNGAPDDLAVSRAEVAAFLEEIEESLPGAGIGAADVRRVLAGLLPASPDDSGSPSTEDRLVDSPGGVVHVMGVKYTTAPSLARRVAELACERLGRSGAARPASGDVRGDASGDVRGDASEAREDELAELRSHDPTLAEVLLDSPRVEAAHVVHAIRREMAATLADIALRRTPLAMCGPAPEPALRRCAEIAGTLLGWDDRRRAREIEDVRVKASGPIADTVGSARQEELASERGLH
jgi:glycerol-3-phosphate dehydrogenase